MNTKEIEQLPLEKQLVERKKQLHTLKKWHSKRYKDTEQASRNYEHERSEAIREHLLYCEDFESSMLRRVIKIGSICKRLEKDMELRQAEKSDHEENEWYNNREILEELECEIADLEGEMEEKIEQMEDDIEDKRIELRELQDQFGIPTHDR